jgi:hypothetical protein
MRRNLKRFHKVAAKVFFAVFDFFPLVLPNRRSFFLSRAEIRFSAENHFLKIFSAKEKVTKNRAKAAIASATLTATFLYSQHILFKNPIFWGAGVAQR